MKWIPINESNECDLTSTKWIEICESKHGNVKRKKQDNQLNWSELGRKNIAREIQRLQAIGGYQRALNAFIGSNKESLLLRTDKGRIRVYLDQGTRTTVGAKKIAYKHLLDGLNASTGGFTLEELNKALPIIQKRGVAVPDDNGMHIAIEIDGVEWRVAFRQFGGAKRWTISTICTKRDQGETRRLVNQLRQKMFGTNC